LRPETRCVWGGKLKLSGQRPAFFMSLSELLLLNLLNFSRLKFNIRSCYDEQSGLRGKKISPINKLHTENKKVDIEEIILKAKKIRGKNFTEG
jgi:hypothetical protein